MSALRVLTEGRPRRKPLQGPGKIRYIRRRNGVHTNEAAASFLEET